jgi:CheY-like chemotaxis protein
MFNSDLKDYTVLLVDDNPDERSGVVLTFMNAAPHVRICIAEDVLQAQAYLSGDAVYADREKYPMPQVIMLDLGLARKSAFRILEWLRDRPQRIPVIILTSSDESSDVDRAYALGASSCLLKSAGDGIMHDIAKGIGDYAALLKLRFVDNVLNNLNANCSDIA